MKSPQKPAGLGTNRRSFTLVELLVVMAIVTLLFVLTLPAALSLMRSSDINRATQMVSDEFDLSRQAAVTQNHDVELRFYQIGTSSNPSDLQFRAFRSLLANASNPAQAQALEKVQFLPASVVISQATGASGTKFSTLLDYGNSLRSGLTTNSEVLPAGVGTTFYVSFLFRSTGGTGLTPVTPPTGIWDVTLCTETAPTNSTTRLPNNYATIQVDPVTGNVRTYRP